MAVSALSGGHFGFLLFYFWSKNFLNIFFGFLDLENIWLDTKKSTLAQTPAEIECFEISAKNFQFLGAIFSKTLHQIFFKFSPIMEDSQVNRLAKFKENSLCHF